MARSVLLGALLVAIGAVAARWVDSTPAPTEPVRYGGRAVSPPDVAREHTTTRARAGDDRYRSDLERRLQLLEIKLAQETAQRQRLEAQLAALAGVATEPAREGSIAMAPTAAEVVASAEEPANTAATAGAVEHRNGAPEPVPAADGLDAAPPSALDYSKSVTEQALAAAGLDAATAEDIKRRQDAHAMTEMSLRNRATREGWADSPRFADEMAALEAQRTTMRDEIGDDAYDRYLVALGRPNRVRIDDVMMQSPAEEAGLQAGDMIVRYGETRIFSPGELVAETHSGALGDAVRLEIIRSGERLEVEVRRGLLGIRVGAIQGTPESG